MPLLSSKAIGASRSRPQRDTHHHGVGGTEKLKAHRRVFAEAEGDQHHRNAAVQRPASGSLLTGINAKLLTA